MLLSSWASRALPRRTFLRVAGSTTAMAGLALAGCSVDTPTPSATVVTYVLSADDNGQLNYFYVLKQLQVAFYKAALTLPASDFLPGELVILIDLHDQEVVQLASIGYTLGATLALPLLTFDFSKLTLTNRASVLTTALQFEDLSSAALNFNVPFLSTAETLALLLKISSVEARHAATVRDLLAPTTLAAPDEVLGSDKVLAATILPADALKVIAPYFAATAVVDVSLLPVA